MENDPEKRFNLFDEKWLPVRKRDGSLEEVSTLDIFKNASQYLSIASELPTLDIAIIRFLLAILHGAFGAKDINGNPFPDDCEGQVGGAYKLWRDLWENKCFPYERIEAYLREHEERFWLFHPEFPFYQIPDMDKGTEYEASKLNGEIAESSNKTRLFSQRSGRKKTGLLYGEAARWLLHINGFDDVSAKATVRGLPSSGAGWLGKLGLIIAVGDTLFETLLLNFVLLKNKFSTWGDDKAMWEKPLHSKERSQINVPNSQKALLSLRSRRLRLIHEGDRVTGCILQGGDFFAKENCFVEQMSIWRSNKKNETAQSEFLPRRHNPSVQLWRDFSSLIEQKHGEECPGVISWLRRLYKKGFLKNEVYHFQTVGVKYGDKDFFIEDIFSDSLSFNIGLLSELNETEKGWIPRIVGELERTKKLVDELGRLAGTIAKASGTDVGNKDKKSVNAARDEAKSLAYYRLDPIFRQWLKDIDPEVADPTSMKMDEECDKWWSQSQKEVRDLGKEIFIEYLGSQEVFKKREGSSLAEVYDDFRYKTKDRETLERKGDNRFGKSIK